jgi:hypothetical protein
MCSHDDTGYRDVSTAAPLGLGVPSATLKQPKLTVAADAPMSIPGITTGAEPFTQIG